MFSRFYARFFTSVLAGAAVHAELPNLLPNGAVENVCVNLLIRDEDFASHIEANETNTPSFWRLTGTASRTEEAVYEGTGAIQLEGGEGSATATAFTDYWRVKDPTMPFGLPLLPSREVQLRFWYRTTPDLVSGKLSAVLKLGVIAGLESDTETMALEPANEWQEVVTVLTPTELRWGAEVTFTLDEVSIDSSAWIDSVHLHQDWGDPVNHVKNPSFEGASAGSPWPAGWDTPIEDEWISWVGARYRAPLREPAAGAGGRYAMRASVTRDETAGVSQWVELNQTEPRLIACSIRSKLDNSIGNQPPGYYGCDNLPNLILYVYHTDGTMQEVSPTFSLGESDHGWDERRGGFMPQKPVHAVRVQATLTGTEPTTTLWLDDAALYELAEDDAGSSPEGGLPRRTLVAAWATNLAPDTDRVQAVNDDEILRFAAPRSPAGGDVAIYLNAHASAPFMEYRRFWYDVVRITEDGAVSVGKVAEKQGYHADGLFEPAADKSIASTISPAGYVVEIPFAALGLDGPPEVPIGFSVVWETPGGDRYWTGNAINREGLGRLVVAQRPGIEIQSLTFGNRWALEPDQSQDFVSHPQIYAGNNEATLVFQSPPDTSIVYIQAAAGANPPSEKTLEAAPGGSTTVTIPYDAGVGPNLSTFSLRLSGGDQEGVSTVFPLDVPSSIEVVVDQEFYYADESRAIIEVHNRYRPLDPGTIYAISIVDETSSTTVWESSEKTGEFVATMEIPVGDLRVNPLPVQDYTLHVEARLPDGTLIGSAERPFGRINQTERRPIPPIERVDVDDEGRLIINGDFRFFPIVPSLSNDDYDDAMAMGANVGRAYYTPGGKPTKDERGIFEIVDHNWQQGAYTMTIGPASGSAIAENSSELYKLLSHPGFLGCYAQQLYYWNLSPDLIDYRKELEQIYFEAPKQKLLVWGHHDSSFLYDLDSDVPDPGAHPIGYCYTKIMGRPGPAWRNAPFLSLTEQVLNPQQFKLGEVNLYVSWADDEIVPEHFKTYRSLRGDDWRGLRNESYLAVIYGADGLYHYVCTQPGGLQRLRGWFQELNYLWPCFVADDAPNRIRKTPASTPIEARLKKWEGKYYLLTANGSEDPAEAEITIDGLDVTHARKLFNLPGTMRADNGTIADTWGQYDAFVYEIE